MAVSSSRPRIRLLGTPIEIAVDMVVLGTGLTARHDAERVAQVFGISQSADGFFMEAHPKLRPVSTNVDGIFIAGCCQGPKDIPDTVAQAEGAAAEVLSLASQGEIEVEATTASIDPEICSGCKLCIEVCPYSAIEFLESKGISAVNEALCKGCGSCTAVCPSKAAQQKHFTQRQVLAEVEGLVGMNENQTPKTFIPGLITSNLCIQCGTCTVGVRSSSDLP